MERKTKIILFILCILAFIIFFNLNNISFFLFKINLFDNTKDFALTNEAVIKEDFKICNKVSEYILGPAGNLEGRNPRMHCYLEVIRKVGDKEVCKKSELINYAGSGLCYFVLAEANRDKSICSLIDSKSDMNFDFFLSGIFNTSPCVR